MTKEQIILAWKNPSYRDTLSAQHASELPPNPAGLIELMPDELSGAVGAEERTLHNWTAGCCPLTDAVRSWLLSCHELM